ncbi:MAG: HpcH/HpaI aldolase/citrate lyase family protein [Acidimicrobiia bacterium]
MNGVLESIRRGKAVLGPVLTMTDEFVAELIGNAGFDFVLIDTQHSPIGIETLQRLMIALRSSQSTILVRIPWNDTAAICQVLDLGADGIIVPLVNSAADARRAVDAAKYPPEGNRSWGPRRAARIHGGPEIYGRTANDRIMILPQIETDDAVSNLDEILDVPGVSGIMIGPADLANSLGYSEDRSNSDVEKVIKQVLDRCLERGVPFGHFTNTFERSREWIERGALITTCGIDVAYISNAIAEQLAEIGTLRASQTEPANA